MSYRYDKDLEFLKDCTNEQLKELFSLLTVDPKDGKERHTEQLTYSSEYKTYGSDYKMYWMRIAEELQLYGGNTIANMFRASSGVLYREILEDVAKEFKVKVASYESTEDIEDNIILSVFMNLDAKTRKEILDSSDEDLAREFKEFGETKINSLGGVMGNVGIQAFRVILKKGGFASYKLTVIAINMVWRKLFGKGLTLATNRILTKTLSYLLAAPIAWALNAWLIADIASPAKRVTVPAVLLISLFRKEVKNREENSKKVEEINN